MPRPVVRLQVVQAVFVLAVMALVARAAQVQLVHGTEHTATARAQRTEAVVLPARRGGIYDRRGTALALTQEVYHVGIAPNELRHARRDAQLVAKHLGMPLAAVSQKLRRRWAYFPGPFSSAQVQPLRALRGVHLTSEMQRFHPQLDLGLTLLGHPASDGRPASGLERTLDTILAGAPGSAVVLRDRRGQRYESPSRLESFPVPGDDVYLTIDAELQEIVEQALTDALERYDAIGGDVVVLEPHTGEILAMASRGEEASGVLTSVFEPGSTAKLFSAAAVLTQGVAQPDDSVWTELGTYTRGSRTIRDDHPAGWLTLQEVIGISSNIGMVKFAQLLTPEALYEMLRDFGLGTPSGVEFPSESPGLLYRPTRWSGTTAASMAMGYEVAVTVMQLAQAYATVANDGILMQPTLVREVRRPDGEVVYRHLPTPVRRVVTPEIARTLLGMFRGVVYEGGTGETAALTAYQVAGKTGTARRAGPNGYIAGSYTASFASLFPADDPQLVMVVKLDDPQGTYARLTAAPVTRWVLEQLLAAKSGALDVARLPAPRVAPAAPPRPTRADEPRWATPWPQPALADSVPGRAIPDVIGESLRRAALDLHAAGFRVRIEGWGEVVKIDPSPGARAAAGTLVTVTARPREARR